MGFEQPTHFVDANGDRFGEVGDNDQAEIQRAADEIEVVDLRSDRPTHALAAGRFGQ